MPSLNKVMIMGNLGQNPDVKRTAKAVIANLNIATTKKIKDESVTQWHKVVIFNKRAEFAEQYLKKGDLVFVEGELQTEKYTDKEGIERFVTKIIASDIKPLQSSSQGKPGRAKESAEEDDYDDDITF